MAGRKVTRLRGLLADAEAKLAESVGSADEPFARNRVQAIAGELDAAVAFRGKYGKKPGPLTEDMLPKAKERKPNRQDAEYGKRKEARRLVGGKVIGLAKLPDLADVAGVIAAEIAVAGVPKDFAAVKPGAPAPLTEEEFENARGIVATVDSDGMGGRLLTDGSVDHARWLAEAFPTLTENRRVKCARFLSGMATMAADKPDENAPSGSTVIEKALRAAGMTYVELENSRITDSRFDAAQAAIKAARKRCIMDRLDETLQNRALYGQKEESVDRFGITHECVKIDNRLAFDMLRYGHDQYMKQNIKDKAAANAMTLMIAQGAYPDAPSLKKEPRQAEVIDV